MEVREEAGRFCRVIQMRSEPALLRRCEDVGKARQVLGGEGSQAERVMLWWGDVTRSIERVLNLECMFEPMCVNTR